MPATMLGSLNATRSVTYSQPIAIMYMRNIMPQLPVRPSAAEPKGVAGCLKRMSARHREASMIQDILGNHILLAGIIVLLLLAVPVLLMRGHKLRDPSRRDRRKHPRPGSDRRA